MINFAYFTFYRFYNSDISCLFRFVKFTDVITNVKIVYPCGLDLYIG